MSYNTKLELISIIQKHANPDYKGHKSIVHCQAEVLYRAVTQCFKRLDAPG